MLKLSKHVSFNCFLMDIILPTSEFTWDKRLNQIFTRIQCIVSSRSLRNSVDNIPQGLKPKFFGLDYPDRESWGVSIPLTVDFKISKDKSFTHQDPRATTLHRYQQDTPTSKSLIINLTGNVHAQLSSIPQFSIFQKLATFLLHLSPLQGFRFRTQSPVWFWMASAFSSWTCKIFLFLVEENVDRSTYIDSQGPRIYL